MNKWLDRYKETVAGAESKVVENKKSLTDKSAISPKTPLLAVLAGNAYKVQNITTTTTSEILDVLGTPTDKRSKRYQEVLSRFIGLAKKVGVDNGILLEETDIIGELDKPEELLDIDQVTPISWSTAVGLRLVRQKGIVPEGWTRVAHCAHCGPIWSHHGLDTLSCAWCEMRLAGKDFPKPE